MNKDDGICQHLAWDSEFFERHIARVTVEQLTQEQAAQALAWCHEHHIDCLYFLATASDVETVRVAEQNGFHFVDVRLALEYDLKTIPAQRDVACTIRAARLSDSQQLRLIAREGHRDTRFYYDPNFPKSKCDALYEVWIENSLRGYADAVLVAEVEGEAVGYVTCKVPSPGNGQIGLFAVGNHAQGKGLGQELIRHCLLWFEAQGVTRVTVVTQGRNVQAQRAYQRQGFRTRAVKLWYHRWFPYTGETHT